MEDIEIVIPKKNSPLKAIRKACLDCCWDKSQDVRECAVTTCVLFPYRFGCNPKTYIKRQKMKGKDVIVIKE